VNSSTLYSTEQFWQPSLLSSKQSSQLTCCALEGRGQFECECYSV